jgi:hypothetical protein
MTLSCSYCVVGATVVGCGWYLTRLARGPSGELLFGTHRHVLNFFLSPPYSRLDQVQSHPLERSEARRERQDDGRQSEVRKEVNKFR